uniref:Uncharacterized protein n=1 Tax=Mola mola TaxID=94237 RepID=A0A3Q3WU62_MOLML
RTDRNLSGPALTRIYNSGVYWAERMKRPLEGMNEWAADFRVFMVTFCSLFSERRVTLGDGSRWLIHKGGNYGISSQTVVVNARQMGPDWRVVQSRNFQGKKTVADFVAAGGSDYSLIFDNCHMGSGRKMNQ